MVSVITPLYNKALHIQRAVESVLAQTYEDFELLVVDDGSTDGGGDIVRRFPDPRVRLIVQENAGASAARNRAIQEARYDLVAFLDADDEWHEDFLETVLSLRKKFPEAAVWGTAYSEVHPGGQMRHLPLDEETRRHPEGLLINFFRFSVRIQQPCNCSSTMVRKDALLKVGGFPAGLVRLTDTQTLFQLALRYPVAYCPLAKAIYHMEAENRAGSGVYTGNFRFFEYARSFLREQGNGAEISEDVAHYLGHMHTGALYDNWLTGNHPAMQEIIRDCQSIRGYRLKCFLWRPLVWIPQAVVLFAWRLHSRLRGRDGKMPPVRSIYRVSVESRKQKAEIGNQKWDQNLVTSTPTKVESLISDFSFSAFQSFSVLDVPVSVVIPLYNKASHIERAVSSVLAQTYQHFELVVVDDGSTDGSGDIVRRFTDPRIRLIVQANAGASAARNRAVQEARYDLVAFLDADDEWHEDFLETVLKLRTKFPQAAVWGTAYTEVHIGGGMRQLPLDEETRRDPEGLLINFFRFSVRIQQPCNCSSTMVRKDALLRVGGFPAGLARLEDTQVLFQLALRYPIAYCPVAKAIYHMEAENRVGSCVYSGNFRFIEYAQAFFREQGNGAELGEDVEDYLGFMHTGALYNNWLAGNRPAMLEILGSCQSLRGYRLKCFLWRPLVWVPHAAVLSAWRLHSRLRGRDGKLPPVRNIYRVKEESGKQKAESRKRKAERAVGSGPVVR
jgi:glycosyltransferase involved in cell wall biosynthesis